MAAILLAQRLGDALGVVLEGVGHGDELDVLATAQAVRRRTGAAAAAADQGDLHLVAAGGVGAAGEAQAAGQRRPGRDRRATSSESRDARVSCVSLIVDISCKWTECQKSWVSTALDAMRLLGSLLLLARLGLLVVLDRLSVSGS